VFKGRLKLYSTFSLCIDSLPSNIIATSSMRGRPWLLQPNRLYSKFAYRVNKWGFTILKGQLHTNKKCVYHIKRLRLFRRLKLNHSYCIGYFYNLCMDNGNVGTEITVFIKDIFICVLKIKFVGLEWHE
jgi:hypothetical protein